MLTREQKITTVLHFTVMCEIDSVQVSPEKIRQRLGDGLLWLDGVGDVEITYDGELLPADNAE